MPEALAAFQARDAFADAPVERGVTVAGVQASPVGGLRGYRFGRQRLSATTAEGTQYFHSDALGSTRALSNATGQGTDQYAYQAFGEIASHSGTSANAFLFAGERRDAQIGMDYLRARWMKPGVGRFASADTWMGSARRPGTLNKYIYGESNPLNYRDPSGEIAIADDILLIGAATVVGACIATNCLAPVGHAIYRSVSSIGELVGRYLGTYRNPNWPPGVWDGDKGAEAWGRRHGVGKNEGRRRFHQGVKQGDNMSGAEDVYGVDPETGLVYDPDGEVVGDLNDPW